MHHAWLTHDIILNAPPSFSKSARADASCGASNGRLDAGVFGGSFLVWIRFLCQRWTRFFVSIIKQVQQRVLDLSRVVVLSPRASAAMPVQRLFLATLACKFLGGLAGFVFSPPRAHPSGKHDSSFIGKGHSMAEELLKVLKA